MLYWHFMLKTGSIECLQYTTIYGETELVGSHRISSWLLLTGSRPEPILGWGLFGAAGKPSTGNLLLQVKTQYSARHRTQDYRLADQSYYSFGLLNGIILNELHLHRQWSTKMKPLFWYFTINITSNCNIYYDTHALLLQPQTFVVVALASVIQQVTYFVKWNHDKSQKIYAQWKHKSKY